MSGRAGRKGHGTSATTADSVIIADPRTAKRVLGIARAPLPDIQSTMCPLLASSSSQQESSQQEHAASSPWAYLARLVLEAVVSGLGRSVGTCYKGAWVPVPSLC